VSWFSAIAVIVHHLACLSLASLFKRI